MGDKGTIATLTKLICGLFLTFVLIKPVTQLNLSGLENWTIPYENQAALAVEQGESRTRKAIASLITRQTKAYILDKAQSLNTALEVEVTLSEDEIPVPVKVRLSGKVSPYAKGRLQSIITEDLGIEKENQTWI